MLYRYTLSRTWGSGPAISFLLLNPSTATEVENDDTLNKCQSRAIRMNYGQMHVVNLFPYRSTDPAKLLQVDPLGDESEANQVIIEAVKLSNMTICGWGANILAQARALEVIKLLRAHRIEKKLYCLARNKDGSPRHPLYIGPKNDPMRFFE